MRKYIANILTASRILGSLAMLFFEVFSPPFYILYLFCGFTDIIDGTVARKTNSVSGFGSKFDSAADFIFVLAALIELLPALSIPIWIWVWILIIAVIKIINILYSLLSENKIMVEHTLLNKITGLLLFALPLTLPFLALKYGAIIVCAVATVAAVQEGHYIRLGKEII